VSAGAGIRSRQGSVAVALEHRGRLAWGWTQQFLWGPESGARLLVVHVGLSLLIGLRIVMGPYRQLAGTPSELVDPVPLLFWIDGMPTLGVIVGLQMVGGLAAAAAVVRWRVRWTFAIAWVCYLVLAGLRGSRGKVMHNDLLLIWASAPFLLAPVTVSLRDRVARQRYGWPIRAAIAIVALIYFFAGYHKLRRSGPGWVIGDNMSNILRWGPSIGETPWEGLAYWMANTPWAAHGAAAFIVGLEVTFLLVLAYPRLRPWYALAAVVLHTGTWLLLGLDYWAWAITVPLVLIDWPAAVQRARQRRLTRRPQLTM
jgi:hypothetical protein